MKCVRCDEDKRLDGFYNRDRTCKECRKALVTANRNANIDHYRQYDRDRASQEKRMDQNRRVTLEWRERNPKERAAQVAAGNAVRDCRRTWRTLAGDIAGLSSEECARIMNHAYGSKVEAVHYDRGDNAQMKLAGMAKWERALEAILAGTAEQKSPAQAGLSAGETVGRSAAVVHFAVSAP